MATKALRINVTIVQQSLVKSVWSKLLVTTLWQHCHVQPWQKITCSRMNVLIMQKIWCKDILYIVECFHNDFLRYFHYLCTIPIWPDIDFDQYFFSRKFIQLNNHNHSVQKVTVFGRVWWEQKPYARNCPQNKKSRICIVINSYKVEWCRFSASLPSKLIDFWTIREKQPFSARLKWIVFPCMSTSY